MPEDAPSLPRIAHTLEPAFSTLPSLRNLMRISSFLHGFFVEIRFDDIPRAEVGVAIKPEKEGFFVCLELLRNSRWNCGRVTGKTVISN